MVAVLAELQARPLPDRSRRRSLLAAVDEYVAGPRIIRASDVPAPVVRPLPRPATVRPIPTRPAARDPQLAQMYLWRRIAVIAVTVTALLLAVWAVSVLGGASLVASEHRGASVSYTVKSGDSLWTVARNVAPNEDPRQVVASLEQSRGGAPLIPGQTIVWAK